MLDTIGAARVLGLPHTTLEAWQRLNIGPPTVTYGRVVTYDAAELTEWADHGGDLAEGVTLLPSARRCAETLDATTVPAVHETPHASGL